MRIPKAWRVTRSDGTEAWRSRVRRGGRVILDRVWETEEKAQAAIVRALLLHKERAPADAHPTLLSFGREWMERRDKRGTVRGMRQEWSMWNAHVSKVPFAKRRLRRIERYHIRRWVEDSLSKEARGVLALRDGLETKELGRTLTSQTVSKHLRLLRQILDSAVERGHIKINPAARLRVPRKARPAKRERWLSLQELRALEGAEIPLKSKTLFVVAAYTGLRLGELLALRWKDIKFSGSPGVSVGGLTKTLKAREVPLLPPAEQALRTWQRARPGLPEAFLWANREGGAMGRTYRGGWERHSRAFLHRPARFHDLRHTCASHLIQGSWDFMVRPLSLEEVQLWLGHSSRASTEIYAHLAPGGLGELVKGGRASRG